MAQHSEQLPPPCLKIDVLFRWWSWGWKSRQNSALLFYPDRHPDRHRLEAAKIKKKKKDLPLYVLKFLFKSWNIFILLDIEKAVGLYLVACQCGAFIAIQARIFPRTWMATSIDKKMESRHFTCFRSTRQLHSSYLVNILFNFSLGVKISPFSTVNNSLAFEIDRWPSVMKVSKVNLSTYYRLFHVSGSSFAQSKVDTITNSIE